MANICSLCSSIPFLDLPVFPKWLRTYHIPVGGRSNLIPFVPEKHAVEVGEDNRGVRNKVKPEMSLGIPYHKDSMALSASANTCELCSIVYKSVLEVKNIWDGEQKNPRFTYYDRSGPPKYELFLSARREDGEDGFIVWSMSEKNTEIFLMASVGYCVDDNSPLSHHFRGRPIAQEATKPVNFERFRSWLKQCESDHQQCSSLESRPTTPTWPLRLLDIRTDERSVTSIKLLESPPVGVKYASLSHCWGDSLQFTLTHATLHSHKEGIKVSSLPKTYQDAVCVAHELGIPYIWIDSLCICQDDGADWERESAKMASIYNNAYLTIASSSASSDGAGFLNPREPPKYVSVPVEVLEGGQAPAVKGNLVLFPVAQHLAASGSHYVEMAPEPLSTRAWALQERFLARRALLFSGGQAFYECAQFFVSEDGYHTTKTWFHLKDKYDNSPSSPEMRPDFYYRAGKKWYEMLRHYSNKKMTKEADKLPALSGLTRAFEDVMGGDYVAGLWKSDLIEGMAFQCFGGKHERPAQWRAPSWSWASIDGTLAVTEIGGWDDLVEVKDVRVEVKGENPYGEVSSGELHLRCTLEKLKVSEEQEKDADKIPHKRHPRLCIDRGDSFGHYVSFDIKENNERVHEMDLWGIPLAARLDDDRPYAYMLVVVPDDSDSRKAFRREGYCFVGGEDALQRWKKAKEGDDLTDVVLI